MIDVAEHPLLDLGVLVARLPCDLGSLPSPGELSSLLALQAAAPIARSEAMRVAVRELLRHGGYKPTGRGKPSSEYLVRVAEEGTLGTVNPAVDAGNIVSLHSGIPISVVDRGRLQPPLRVVLAVEGSRYVFNRSGQEIDVSGLIGLEDATGPCANAVKDSQRTKTHAETRELLCLLGAPRGFAETRRNAIAWLASLLESFGATVETIS
jgi:DNA/RNA-binding domain of Phe-tRNA-synthetase-like protein